MSKQKLQNLIINEQHKQLFERVDKMETNQEKIVADVAAIKALLSIPYAGDHKNEVKKLSDNN